MIDWSGLSLIDFHQSWQRSLWLILWACQKLKNSWNARSNSSLKQWKRNKKNTWRKMETVAMESGKTLMKKNKNNWWKPLRRSRRINHKLRLRWNSRNLKISRNQENQKLTHVSLSTHSKDLFISRISFVSTFDNHAIRYCFSN
jgi:hypothetical protein